MQMQMPVLGQDQGHTGPLTAFGPLQQVLIMQRRQVKGQLGLDGVEIIVDLPAAQTGGGIDGQVLQQRRVDGRFHKIPVPGIDEPLVQPVQGMVDMLPQRRAAIGFIPQLVGNAVNDVLRFPQRTHRHFGQNGMVG